VFDVFALEYFKLCAQSYSAIGSFGVGDWQTFPALCHDVQLTGDLFGVNRPLYVSQHGQLSHSSSWGQ